MNIVLLLVDSVTFLIGMMICYKWWIDVRTLHNGLRNKRMDFLKLSLWIGLLVLINLVGDMNRVWADYHLLDSQFVIALIYRLVFLYSGYRFLKMVK